MKVRSGLQSVRLAARLALLGCLLLTSSQACHAQGLVSWWPGNGNYKDMWGTNKAYNNDCFIFGPQANSVDTSKPNTLRIDLAWPKTIPKGQPCAEDAADVFSNSLVSMLDTLRQCRQTGELPPII